MGVEVQRYFFFDFGGRWGWVVNATPPPLYPGKEKRYAFCRRWVGLRAGLDECGKSRPHRVSIPGPSSQ